MKIEEKKLHKVVLYALKIYDMLISGDTPPEDLNNFLEAWYNDSVALMKGEEDEE